MREVTVLMQSFGTGKKLPSLRDLSRLTIRVLGKGFPLRPFCRLGKRPRMIGGL
jgi:hypothetical protein